MRGQFVELTFNLYKMFLSLSNQIHHAGTVLTDMETAQIFGLQSDSRMQSYILNAFTSLFESLSEKEKNRYSPIVYAAIGEIHQKYRENSLSLNTLANNIHVNPSYLSRLFKTEKSVGIMDYINIYRVAHAADLLLTTTLTVKNISLRCGFDNYNYFFKVFKKYTDTTPNEFRGEKNANILTALDDILI